MNKDEKLKHAVKKFQNGFISRRIFLQEVNSIILNIPVYLGYNNKDIKHEFYAHIISKIEKIIFSYKEMPTATFLTWFNVVLKRDFFNFIKKFNKNKNESFENNQILKLFGNDLQQNEYDSTKVNNYFPNLSILTEREKNVVALKFGLKIQNRHVSDSVNQILERLEKKKKIEVKITKKYFRIINLQKNISEEINFDVIKNLKNEELKIKYSKRRLEKILGSYSILPTNRWVGEKLGLSAGTIGAYLNKIKTKLLKTHAKKLLLARISHKL